MSNHIADANKMVDTPRMNSVAGHARGIVDAAIFAEGMKLERELNAMTRERDEAVASATLHWEKFGASRMTYDAAERRNADLIARIKRLEEAGDEMEKYCRDYYSSNKWYKAREAKP